MLGLFSTYLFNSIPKNKIDFLKYKKNININDKKHENHTINT